MSGNSLAFATGTRVDSVEKHIMTCKIDTQTMKTYAGREGVTLHDLDHQKLDFLTEKDDLVLNACQKLFKSSDDAFHAYQPVVSHLGKCTPHLEFFMQWLYSLRGHNIWNTLNMLSTTGSGPLSVTVSLAYAHFRAPTQTSLLQDTVDAKVAALNALATTDPVLKLFNMELAETTLLQM
jgi:hypothetical protein